MTERQRPNWGEVYVQVVSHALPLVQKYVPHEAMVHLVAHLNRGMDYVLPLLYQALAPVEEDLRAGNVLEVIEHLCAISGVEAALVDPIVDSMEEDDKTQLAQHLLYLLFLREKLLAKR